MEVITNTFNYIVGGCQCSISHIQADALALGAVAMDAWHNIAAYVGSFA